MSLQGWVPGPRLRHNLGTWVCGSDWSSFFSQHDLFHHQGKLGRWVRGFKGPGLGAPVPRRAALRPLWGLRSASVVRTLVHGVAETVTRVMGACPLMVTPGVWGGALLRLLAAFRRSVHVCILVLSGQQRGRHRPVSRFQEEAAPQACVEGPLMHPVSRQPRLRPRGGQGGEHRPRGDSPSARGSQAEEAGTCPGLSDTRSPKAAWE